MMDDLALLAEADVSGVDLRRSNRRIGLLLAGWAVAVGLGFVGLLHYSATPGESAEAPATWPAGATVPLDREAPTLIMVLHPQCSCSRASVAELSRLMTQVGERARGHVLFVRPSGVGEDFARSDLWSSASIIDGVALHVDVGGQEAARFGARTSGQVYLYAPSGALMFSGGITPSRSHQGDSVGRQRLLALLSRGHGSGDRSAVYGCGIEDTGDGPPPASLAERL